MEGWLTSVLGAVAFVAGFAAKSVDSWLQDRRARRRETEARAEARKDRWVELQRQTLLDLQEAGLNLARFAGATHHADRVSFRARDAWRAELLPEDVNEGFRVSQGQTTLLMARIHDGAVREATLKLKIACTAVALAFDEADSISAVSDVANAHEAFQDQIGLVFRTLDKSALEAPAVL